MNEICGINNWNGSLGGKGSLIRGKNLSHTSWIKNGIKRWNGKFRWKTEGTWIEWKLTWIKCYMEYRNEIEV